MHDYVLWIIFYKFGRNNYITHPVYANMSGSEKKKKLVIGKCLKNNFLANFNLDVLRYLGKFYLQTNTSATLQRKNQGDIDS